MERCKCPAPATDMAIGHLVRKPNLVGLKLRAMEFADKKLPLDVATSAVTKTSLHVFALFCIGGSRHFAEPSLVLKEIFPDSGLDAMYVQRSSLNQTSPDSKLQPPQSSSKNHGTG